MMVTKQKEDEIRRVGYGISGDIGGIGKQTYFTPDGRRIRSVPNTRDYVLKDKDGKVIESGTRDGNFDKGWLPVMPTELKPHCDGCGDWHDTQEGVDKCIKGKEEQTRKWDEYAEQQKKKNTDAQNGDVEELRVEVLEMRGQMNEILEILKGGIVQSEDSSTKK